MTTYRPIIGLEIHAKLNTINKLFSQSSAISIDGTPNSLSDEFSCGIPGTYPCLNPDALKLAIKLGIVLHSKINNKISFDRKIYMYHDLVKNYQITQQRNPILLGGQVDYLKDVNTNTYAHSNIIEAHIEEDVCGTKILNSQQIGIDTNRSGIPLIEIVTAPDIHSPEDAVKVAKTLRNILVEQKISDCNMNLGEFRIDCNISITISPDNFTPTYRTEIKNLNSFEFMKAALTKEIARQTSMYNQGMSTDLKNTTYKWISDKQVLMPMRNKQNKAEYCYIPEPNIPAINISKQLIDNIVNNIEESFKEKQNFYINKLGISTHHANLLTSCPEIYEFFDRVIKYTSNYKETCIWIVSHLFSIFHKKQDLISGINKISPKILAQIIDITKNNPSIKQDCIRIFKQGIINNKLCEDILSDIVKKQQAIGQATTTQVDIQETISNILNKHNDVVRKYQSGHHQSLNFLIKEVIIHTKGTIIPNQVPELVKTYIDKSIYT